MNNVKYVFSLASYLVSKKIKPFNQLEGKEENDIETNNSDHEEEEAPLTLPCNITSTTKHL